MGKKYEFNPKNLYEQRKEIEKKINQLKVPCSHMSAKGNPKLNELNRNGLMECKLCGTKFNIIPEDLETVEKAVRVLHNILNQIKVFSINPNEERAIIKELGELDYNLVEIPKLYARVMEYSNEKEKKKKKNKQQRDDSFGSYGINSISFINSGKKRR